MNDNFTASFSFMPSSCKVVKRKAWLNLIKFIDRDAMSRKQSAIILASGNFRIKKSVTIRQGLFPVMVFSFGSLKVTQSSLCFL